MHQQLVGSEMTDEINYVKLSQKSFVFLKYIIT
jgi:hypothetical protein